MNREVKKMLKRSFYAPEPTRKAEFLDTIVAYPKATNLEFWLSQVGYIRKRFWLLSVLVLGGLLIFSLRFKEYKEFVGVLSAVLPLLSLIAITEISRSISYNMIELEMSCKYNLSKITITRLAAIGTFHFGILLLSLLIFKNQSQYGIFRYGLYALTPFFLSSYLSLWVTNHFKSKDSLYVCFGVTLFISIVIFIMSSNFVEIYNENYTLLWSMVLILITVLVIKEIYYLLKERNEQWNYV